MKWKLKNDAYLERGKHMPISTVTNRVEYQGDGTSAIFAFAYPLHAQADLAVFAYNSSATTPAIITPMTLNGAGGFGFTISGNADPSGVYVNGVNAVANSAPNLQTILVIFRSSALTNTFSVGQSGAIPSTGLNNELNYLTLLAQRHQDQLTRSIRLHDGLPGSFDMTLPNDIRSRPGQIFAVNSNANGLILTDELAGSYVPNTVIVATGTSAVGSLGGAPPGLFLQSNGSSAPTWVGISLGSSATVPSGNITGVLTVGQGGTGTATSYIQYGVFFASSAVELANTAAGGADIPLVGNAGGAPSFQALSLLSGSSTVGTLPVTKGGTGVVALVPQYGVCYMSSVTEISVIPSAAAATVLTANG